MPLLPKTISLISLSSLRHRKIILDLEVRYKGSFSPSPQFLGGITKQFEDALESKDSKVHYQFGKACD